MFLKTLTLGLLAVCLAFGETYAERLGWKKGDRVVIIHVDDAGMSHDSNLGVEEALEHGIASSFSIMMPCSWVPEIIHYVKGHPNADAGIHVTLTSEWFSYRWPPLIGNLATGLIDTEGDMWHTVAEVVDHASPDEVDREIRAQLQRARQMGLTPTHLDSHMGTVFATPEFLSRYISIGAEAHIPVMFPGGHDTLLAEQLRADEHTQNPPELKMAAETGEKIWNLGLPVLDDLHNVSYGWHLPASEKPTDENLRRFKTEKYKEAFHKLRPGVTMIIMHCTDASSTFQAISNSGNTRRGDLLAMTNPELRKALESEGLIVTTWRELGERRRSLEQHRQVDSHPGKAEIRTRPVGTLALN